MDGTEEVQAGISEATETTAENETPTEVVQPDYKAELEKLQAELKAKEESYKGLQRTLNKTNEELKRQSQLDTKIEDLEEKIKLLAAIYADSGKENVDDIQPEKKVNYLEQFEQLETKKKQEREQKEFISRVSDLEKRTRESGLTEDDLEYHQIKNAAVQRDFAYAEALLKNVEKKKGTTVAKQEKPEEDFEARVKAEVDKRIAEATKTNPLLKTDSAVPSGKAKTAQDTLNNFLEGKATYDEYRQARKELGIG